MQPFLEIAHRFLEIVERAWTEHSKTVGGFEQRDENERQLLLGYVQAHRRFRAITRLAEDERPSPEAVLVLARSLVSVAHRTLYLVASDDPDERRQRLQRFLLLSGREERAHLEAVVEEVPSLRPLLELARESVAQREGIFREQGWSLEKPIFPLDEQIARELGFVAHYDEVYRSGSGHMHHSAFSAAGGFAKLEEGEWPTIALYGDDTNEPRQAMVDAIVVYADFLIAAEKFVGLGVGPKIEALRPELAKAVENAKADLKNQRPGGEPNA